MCVEKYPQKYAGKYRQKYPDSCARLRRHVCLRLYLHVHLDLNPELFAELYREKFEKSFQQLFREFFASLFGLLFDLKHLQFQGWSYLVLYRQTLPRGQSLGRPLHGGIVSGWRPTTTRRCPPTFSEPRPEALQRTLSPALQARGISGPARTPRPAAASPPPGHSTRAPTRIPGSPPSSCAFVSPAISAGSSSQAASG
jgi:hypothetical protein